MDPDAILKAKIVEFVDRGDFGLASGRKSDGTYDRVWFEEQVGADEAAFETDVFLLRKAAAQALNVGSAGASGASPEPVPDPIPGPRSDSRPDETTSEITGSMRTLRLAGTVPPEIWNRLGTKILPNLRSGSELSIGLEFSVTVPTDAAHRLATDLRQILQELGLAEAVRVE